MFFVLFGFGFLGLNAVHAGEVDIDNILQFPVRYYPQTHEYHLTVIWDTDVTTTGKIIYGTSSGSLTTEVEELDDNGQVETGTEHTLTLVHLTPNTTYYYRIVAEDDDANSERSRERSFRTYDDALDVEFSRFVIRGHNMIVIETWSNMTAAHGVLYGTSPDNLNKVAFFTDRFEVGQPYNKGYHVVSKLKPNTRYYFKVVATQGRDPNTGEAYDPPLRAETSIFSGSTTGRPKITSVSPTSGRRGTTITITGMNFGPYMTVSHEDWLGRVWFACTPDKKDKHTPFDPVQPRGKCGATIQEWTDSRIVAKLEGGTPLTGRIYVSKKFGVPFKMVNPYTIKGPVFTVR